MPRVKRGVQHLKRRRTLLKKTKGFIAGRKSSVRQAHTAVLKAGAHAYVGRKKKKRVYRALWQVRLNAAVRPHGVSYSRFMDLCKKQNVALDRKVLAVLAADHPTVFDALVKELLKK